MDHAHTGLHAVCLHRSPPDTSQATMTYRRVDRQAHGQTEKQTDR